MKDEKEKHIPAYLKPKKYSFGGIEGDDLQSVSESIIAEAKDEEAKTNLKHLCEDILARLR